MTPPPSSSLMTPPLAMRLTHWLNTHPEQWPSPAKGYTLSDFTLGGFSQAVHIRWQGVSPAVVWLAVETEPPAAMAPACALATWLGSGSVACVDSSPALWQPPDEAFGLMRHAPAEPTFSLEEMCRQGEVLSYSLLQTMGQRLAAVHQTPLPPDSPLVNNPQWADKMQRHWCHPFERPAQTVENGTSAQTTAAQTIAAPGSSAPLAAMKRRFLEQHGASLHTLAQTLLVEAQRGGGVSETLPAHPDAAASPLACSLGYTGARQWVTHGTELTVWPSPYGRPLASWWDVGLLLGWMPLLVHASYAAVDYGQPLVQGYLQAGTVAQPYPWLRFAMQVAGVQLAALLLEDEALPWLKDVYLKETFLRQAVKLTTTPFSVPWVASLSTSGSSR